jgi:hypothetical protein
LNTKDKGAEAYPLQWPDGWPRTPDYQVKDGKYNFRRVGHYTGNQFWTFGAARDALLDEVRKLGGRNVVLSSNFRVGRDGIAIEGKSRPRDQGVAVYFTVDGTPYAMARDSYVRAEENMRSLALAIDAMRQLERHGGSTMLRRAFAGFVAIAPPTSCWEILGIKPGASEAEIQAAYRKAAREAHPDAGGSDERMSEVNRARDEALRQVAA